MDEPLAAPLTGDLFDGTSARRRKVALAWDGAGLTLTGPEVPAETVRWDELAYADAVGGFLSYSRPGRSGWRLRVPDFAPGDLLALLPRPAPYGRWVDRLGLGKSVVAFGVISAGIALAVFTAPTWLGPLVPESVERGIGQAMIGDLEQFTCNSPASDAALAKLSAAMDPGGSKPGPKVRVELAKVDMVNAVALPGGRVLIFDKLVQDARSPEELAGVVGHEIGHVRERHVMQALLRQFGLSILLSGANSDITGTLGGLAAMGYSRKAEAEADDFARAQLARNHVSPIPTAEFFARLRKDDPTSGSKTLSYFASHPDTKSREQKFLSAVKPGQTYKPVLSAPEWAAIRSACKADTTAEEWTLF